MINDPDALRSERYTLQKLAIEHHLIGDSATGILSDTESNKLIDITDASKQNEDEK
jgi:hypothetical protein